ncbi:hypothetical protein BC739_004169 [Kutzneria viridogrisea]|uniref:Transposase DDE domain-containing protein n=1 Tax=Kutzneria viridogrisea TaxID=47990 RepID=A0ABR6BJ90_9PSEU|nr:hypothetical protein [Kutzneria viridogrisea]
MPVTRLSERVGLAELADHWLKVPGPTGANAGAKVASIVAGMAAGADSVTDLDLIRHGALPRLFTQVKAASTLGAFLRGLCGGDISSLDAVARRVLQRLAAQTPLLPRIDQIALIDIDSKITQVHGRAKQGAAYGYTKVLGLHFQAVTLSTPHAAPVILQTRLRGGNAGSGRKAASLLRQALGTARACGATGPVLVRGDSTFFSGTVIATIGAAGAWFSITAPHNPAVTTAIAAIDQAAWRPIRYPRPVLDTDTGQWVTHAEIAETTLTAFTNPTDNPGRTVTARLLVRRVPAHTPTGQDGLFPLWRYHAVFTDNPTDPATAWAQHNGRAGAIEQVFADLNNSALAHFPSGKFAANAAWLTLAALTHNLMRALGCLAGGRHATARTGTLRRHLVTVAARLARTARTLTLHLPRNWPWQRAWQQIFDRTHHPPAAA